MEGPNQCSDLLSTSIEVIKGVGPKLAKTLAKKGIATYEDALYFLPRAYEDRRHITPIARVGAGNLVTVFGTVRSSRLTRMGRQSRFEATLSDETGSLRLFWFRAFPRLAAELAEGTRVIVYGKVEFFAGIPRISHPEYERVTDMPGGKLPVSYHFGRVVPVYSETDGLNQKLLRRVMGEALKGSLPALGEPLPEELRTRLKLTCLRDSFVGVHFPKDCPEEGTTPPAARRIIFEEFFVLQLGLGLKQRRLKSRRAPALVDNLGYLDRFFAGLPFPLTGDQNTAIDAMRRDLAGTHPMTRLVQGDVGAGKTVVALAGAAIAASQGYQTALMAPTEILAQQHYQSAVRWLSPLGIQPQLLVASTSGKKGTRESVAAADSLFVVGTHALFQKEIRFGKLGLVIVDEQHRFGVEQRAELAKKAGELCPHLLMMTATPIPRTLALTLYGDLDLTLIREKPAGRKPVQTTILRECERPRLYTRIREAVGRGEQVYVIYPLVEASEKLDLKSATEMYERLRKEIFPELRLAVLHGRMKADEKQTILAAFKAHQYDLLVSTTVIEVGIDVPNATLMIIEHPERLGLSQLHQLRGRVGRGERESRCVLVADQFVSERLKVMERTDDGFEIAEEDLKLRGPGEFLGTRQSGLPGFRVGHILRDASLLAAAREEAKKVLSEDPTLSRPEHALIRRLVESRWKGKIERLVSG